MESEKWAMFLFSRFVKTSLLTLKHRHGKIGSRLIYGNWLFLSVHLLINSRSQKILRGLNYNWLILLIYCYLRIKCQRRPSETMSYLDPSPQKQTQACCICGCWWICTYIFPAVTWKYRTNTRSNFILIALHQFLNTNGMRFLNNQLQISRARIGKQSWISAFNRQLVVRDINSSLDIRPKFVVFECLL